MRSDSAKLQACNICNVCVCVCDRERERWEGGEWERGREIWRCVALIVSCISAATAARVIEFCKLEK